MCMYVKVEVGFYPHGPVSYLPSLTTESILAHTPHWAQHSLRFVPQVSPPQSLSWGLPPKAQDNRNSTHVSLGSSFTSAGRKTKEGRKEGLRLEVWHSCVEDERVCLARQTVAL